MGELDEKIIRAVFTELKNLRTEMEKLKSDVDNKSDKPKNHGQIAELSVVRS